MGWVGVGVLVATVCFLLYRYPSRLAASRSAATPSEPTSAETSPSTDEAVKAGDNSALPVKVELSPEEKNTATEEVETTPKALAPTAPTIEVPPLHLDGDKTTEKQGQLQMNGSKDGNPEAKNAMMPPPQPQVPAASSSSLMPPPPLPRLRPTSQQNQPSQSIASATEGRYPPRPSGGSLRPPPSTASSLRPPPSTTSSLCPPPSAASSLRVPPKPAANTLSPNGSLKPSTSKRAVIEPGYSQLDWAALKSNPNHNLRGNDAPPNLIKVTPSMLKAQNGRKGRDAWTTYQGKVYNISSYLPFHPGGKGELLRGAGKDSAKLFFEVHPWVNWDAILGECLVGILVSENDDAANGGNGGNKLDDMD